LVLININRYEGASEAEIYEQTRMAWRIDRRKAQRADFVLSVVRGVVIEAFVADEWLPATVANFPRLAESIPTRSGFIGKLASQEIRDLYVGKRGKRIALDGLKHIQNPIRYWNL
jgi:hypothetical protein